MKIVPKRKAAEITLIYLVIGVLWIFFSDFLLLRFFDTDPNAESISFYQTFKGWFYVLFTALVLYILTRGALRDQSVALHKLTDAEAEILESHTLIEHLLEASPTVLYALAIKNQTIETLWASESLQRIFGYTDAEFMSPHWWSENLHPEDKELALAQAVRLIREGHIDHQYRFRSRTGEYYWTRDIARVLYDKQGNPYQIIGSWTNVTSQHEEEERMRLFFTAFDGIGEGILVADMQLRITSVNKAATAIFGYEEHELLGKNPSILSSGNHDEYYFKVMKTALNKTGVWHGEIWNQNKMGDIIPLWLSICIAKNVAGQPEQYIAIYTDISELKKTETELQYLALHDALTNLPNRTQLLAHLQHSLNQAARLKSQIAVLFIDLDDFKNVNDSMGHTIGDELLIAVTKRLLQRVRAEDMLARLGGDEFLLVSGFIDNADNAAVIAGALLDVLRPPFQLSNGLEVFVEACIGISIAPNNGLTPDELLRNADTAMYRAKSLGRNSFCFYEAEMSNTVIELLQIETDMRMSIERNELQLFYQPKIDLRSGKISGAEALLRWSHSQLGMISPAKFIPIAEKSGLIVPLGRWVIRESCRRISQWLAEDLDPINVAINISLAQFFRHEQELVDLIRDTLREFEIPPHYLSLEITESVLMDNSGLVNKVLQEMNALGVQLVLDDFGTGYSNLAYLAKLPLDVLKIDTSFTRGVGCNDRNRDNLVKSVINMAQNLNMKTVAEGVETVEQMQFLRQHGCDELQGYLFSAPVDADTYSEYLRSQKTLALD